MKLGAMTAKTGVLLLVCAGLLVSSAAIAGCDADVNAVLVEGMNSAAVTAATALIDAGFQAVTPDEEPYNNNTGGGGDTIPSI